MTFTKENYYTHIFKFIKFIIIPPQINICNSKVINYADENWQKMKKDSFQHINKLIENKIYTLFQILILIFVFIYCTFLPLLFFPIFQFIYKYKIEIVCNI